jgi:hypothetical protein
MRQEKSFWIVWNETSKEVRFRHETEDSANAEARRLASLHKGVRFVVFCATGAAIVRDPVEWDTFDLIPF